MSTDDLFKSFPRRRRLELLTKEEKELYIVHNLIEEMGADPLLTEVSNLIFQAREKLADYVDNERLNNPIHDAN